MLPIIVDAHEDLAYNILTFGRDYTRAAIETRRLEDENDSTAPEHNGETLLGWPDYQRGRVAVIFSTLFAMPIKHRAGEWDKQSYGNFDQAHRLYRSQLDAYHRLTDDNPEKFHLITSRTDLQTILTHWAEPKLASHPVGLVPLMEGAEGIRTLSELEDWWEWGVRVIGPAWVGTRFCGGTRDPGPLTDEGRLLLKAMAEIGFTLDLSHMDELSARQSLDLYSGPIIVSHANVAELVPLCHSASSYPLIGEMATRVMVLPSKRSPLTSTGSASWQGMPCTWAWVVTSTVVLACRLCLLEWIRLPTCRNSIPFWWQKGIMSSRLQRFWGRTGCAISRNSCHDIS
jgi:microsomal dipeptidase-like Zn-dependent dipeptidase